MTDPVLMLDLTRLHEPMRDALTSTFEQVSRSGSLVLGERCASFEATWASVCDSSAAVGVSSGLAALTLSLRALGIGPGDEVIVPAHTFIATWLAVSAVGATPVPVEVDERTYLLRPDAASAAITERTSAVLPVHLYGAVADVAGFESLSSEHGLALVFDAAQAHGARWGDMGVGGFGHATAWSFYPGKNLGAFGDAGAVTTRDSELAQRVGRLRNYGRTAHDEFAERGSNDRIDELQAALLETTVSWLPVWQQRRVAIAARYLEALAGADVVLPTVTEGQTHGWHQFVIRSGRRDALRESLLAREVHTGIHYRIPPHQQLAYADLGFAALPGAEQLAAEVLSLPIAPHLRDDEVERVIAAVLECA